MQGVAHGIKQKLRYVSLKTVTFASLVPTQISSLCHGLLLYNSQVWSYVMSSLCCWNLVPED